MSEAQKVPQEAITQQKRQKEVGYGTVGFREGVISPIFQSIKTFLVMHAAVMKPELAAQAAQQSGKEDENERRRQENARERNAENSKTTISPTGSESPAQLLEMYTKAQGQLTAEQLQQVRAQLEVLSAQKTPQSQPVELPKAA